MIWILCTGGAISSPGQNYTVYLLTEWNMSIIAWLKSHWHIVGWAPSVSAEHLIMVVALPVKIDW